MMCLTKLTTRCFTRLTGLSLMTVAMVHLLTFQNQALASSTDDATGTATTTILASIAIAPARALSFGTGAPGDAAKRVLATDAANSARFNVTGTAGAQYNIFVPTTNVLLTHSVAGTGNRDIIVNAFDSFPANSGVLSNPGGAQTISVGATRELIPADQVAGAYSGTFTVTVTYQ